MVLVVFAFALLAAGTGVVVLRTDRAAMSCRAVTACTSRVFGIDTGASLRVVIADRTVFGWRSPTAIGFCNGKFWVTDPAANSVAEFDWKSDGMPVIGPDDHYRFARPHVLTGRRGRLWIATANSITEMNAIDGKVIRVVARAATRNVTALVLFGRRLWVANTRNLAEINATTGTLLGVFRSHRYGFDRPTALAVSNRRLWVISAGNGSVTEMDAATGRWIATLPGNSLGGRHPIAVTADRTTLWIASEGTNSVSQIDTATGRLVRVVGGARYGLADPTAMAVIDGRLWVTNAGANSVTQIDVRTGRLVGYLTGARFGFASPAGLVAHLGRVWVMNQAAGSVTELIPPPRQRPATAPLSAANN